MSSVIARAVAIIAALHKQDFPGSPYKEVVNLQLYTFGSELQSCKKFFCHNKNMLASATPLLCFRTVASRNLFLVENTFDKDNNKKQLFMLVHALGPMQFQHVRLFSVLL